MKRGQAEALLAMFSRNVHSACPMSAATDELQDWRASRFIWCESEVWGALRENQIVTEDNLDSLQQRCAPSPAIRSWPDEHWPRQGLWPIWPWAANWRFCSVMAFALIVVVLFVDSCLKKSAYFTWCELGLPTKKADVQKYRTVAQFGDDEKCPGFSGRICGSSSENFANTMTVSLSGWICGSSSESFAHTMTVSLSYWTRRYMLRLRFKTLIEGILKKMWAIAETKPAELRWKKVMKKNSFTELTVIFHRTYSSTLCFWVHWSGLSKCPVSRIISAIWPSPGLKTISHI